MIMGAETKKRIYIVMSQTGTWLSSLLKKVTGERYNHVSISLERDLYVMYSFGRLNPYNPFVAGFVQESPYRGTFKRFSETEVLVVSLEVDKIKYDRIKEFLENMYKHKELYKYNYIGLFIAALNICYEQKNRYYCSEFIKKLLLRFHVFKQGDFQKITKPIDFKALCEGPVVYQGKLRCYNM